MRGIERLTENLSRANDEFQLNVPSYANLLALLRAKVDGDSSFARKLAEAWSERSFNVYYDRPLLLVASLRALALSGGERHPLFRAIGCDDPDPSTATVAALDETLEAEGDALFAMLATRRVQTNDTNRAVIWRWPAYLGGFD